MLTVNSSWIEDGTLINQAADNQRNTVLREPGDKVDGVGRNVQASAAANIKCFVALSCESFHATRPVQPQRLPVVSMVSGEAS